MDTKEVTIQLMKDLVASEAGLLPYTLYKRYGVTPLVLIQIVKRLQEKGFLLMGPENRLILTREGRDNAEGFIARLNRSRSAIVKAIDSCHRNNASIVPTVQKQWLSDAVIF